MGDPENTTSAEEEVDVLFPDIEVTVRDPDTGESVTLTVREFRFLEGLKAQVRARPLIEALAGVEHTDDEIRDAHAIMDVLADHAEAWCALIALASDRTADWVAGLSDADGNALGRAMWEANKAFLSLRVAEAALSRRPDESRSRKSSTPSSGPDTGQDT